MESRCFDGKKRVGRADNWVGRGFSQVRGDLKDENVPYGQQDQGRLRQEGKSARQAPSESWCDMS